MYVCSKKNNPICWMCELGLNKTQPIYFDKHPRSKYWSEKNKLKPHEVSIGIKTNFIFDCDKCGHEFLSNPNRICNMSTWCSYCKGKELCSNDDCKICFNKSFASNEKSIYWNTRNEYRPRDIRKASDKQYFYLNCPDCNHEIETTAHRINDNKWCVYCVNQKLCDKEDCEFCFQNSLASHPLAEFWNYEKNNEIKLLKPRNYFKGSKTVAYFNCPKCEHVYHGPISNYTISNNNCGFCSLGVRRRCKPEENCKKCHARSFAAHPNSKYLQAGEPDPTQIAKFGSTMLKFKCEKGHKFEKIAADVSRGKWCGICFNKTEELMYNTLLPAYPNLQHQFKADWCKSIETDCYLRFDFALENEKIIIELDGPQHFEQISNWKSPADQQENDKLKQDSANLCGYSVIRVIWFDIYKNKYDWYVEISKNIQKIINEGKMQNIYICYDNEFDFYDDYTKYEF